MKRTTAIYVPSRVAEPGFLSLEKELYDQSRPTVHNSVKERFLQNDPVQEIIVNVLWPNPKECNVDKNFRSHWDDIKGATMSYDQRYLDPSVDNGNVDARAMHLRTLVRTYVNIVEGAAGMDRLVNIIPSDILVEALAIGASPVNTYEEAIVKGVKLP